MVVFFFKQKTADEMRISDWSSDVCSSDLLPEAGGRRGGDGDATLLLLLHPVHGGIAVMGLAELMGDTGVVEDALGRRRLAGIDVGQDRKSTRLNSSH